VGEAIQGPERDRRSRQALDRVRRVAAAFRPQRLRGRVPRLGEALGRKPEQFVDDICDALDALDVAVRHA
jgi:hypothetical protein